MNVVAVIPAYNEGTRVDEVVKATLPFVNTVIVIDDGSSDNTAEIAKRSGAMVLSHPLNCGSGAATMTGIEAARTLDADVIVTLDADGQHVPENITDLVAAITDGYDLAFANRFGKKNTIPISRRLGKQGSKTRYVCCYGVMGPPIASLALKLLAVRR